MVGGARRALPDPVAALLGALSSDDAATLRRWHEHWPEADAEQLDAVLGDGEGPALAAVMRRGRGGARRAVQVALGRTWSARQISADRHGAPALADPRPDARRPRARRTAATRPVRRCCGSGPGSTRSGRPFAHAVCALGPATTPGFVAGADNHGLTEPQQRTLENVMMELRMAETDESSGAWLFARVVGDGETVRIERAYDCWPAWYAAPGRPDHGGAARRDGPAPSRLAAVVVEPAPRRAVLSPPTALDPH